MSGLGNIEDNMHFFRAVSSCFFTSIDVWNKRFPMGCSFLLTSTSVVQSKLVSTALPIGFYAQYPAGSHMDIKLWLPLEPSHLTWVSALSLPSSRMRYHLPGCHYFFFAVDVFSLITLNPVSWLFDLSASWCFQENSFFYYLFLNTTYSFVQTR